MDRNERISQAAEHIKRTCPHDIGGQMVLAAFAQDSIDQEYPPKQRTLENAWTVEKIVDYARLPMWAGFCGERCGQCDATINTLGGAPGWFCLCGHYNTQHVHAGPMPHKRPDSCPPLEMIQDAIRAVRKTDPTCHEISRVDWAQDLKDCVHDANPNDTIICFDKNVQSIAKQYAKHNRPAVFLVFIIDEKAGYPSKVTA